MNPTSPQVETDILILGGGIQGLWLLADLVDAGYQAVALERSRPGCGQTGHSHVFLHRGHMHASMRSGAESVDDAKKRIQLFQDAHERWTQELSAGRLKAASPLRSPFYIGWKTKTRADPFLAACKSARIDCTPLNKDAIPSMFKACSLMFEAEGMCLESNRVLECLLEHKNLRDRISQCDHVQLLEDGANGFRLSVERSGSTFDLLCRGLVLSAGAGNEHLLREVLPAGGIHLDVPDVRQQTVKTFMLVLKAREEDLRPLCGMFPEFSGIFIAHRQCSGGYVVWLIADGQRHHIRVPGQWTTLDARGWFKNIRPELEKLMPWLVNHPERYRWGIYEAAKGEPWTSGYGKYADGGLLPKQHKICKDPKRNLWVSWPGFLTLAPMAAEEIVRQIEESGIAPGPHSVNQTTLNQEYSGVTPDEDKWKATPLLDWSHFQACYA